MQAADIHHLKIERFEAAQHMLLAKHVFCCDQILLMISQMSAMPACVINAVQFWPNSKTLTIPILAIRENR